MKKNPKLLIGSIAILTGLAAFYFRPSDTQNNFVSKCVQDTLSEVASTRPAELGADPEMTELLKDYADSYCRCVDDGMKTGQSQEDPQLLSACIEKASQHLQ